MQQAISTKYSGPGNRHGSRIKALARKAQPAFAGFSSGKELSKFSHYLSELNPEANHAAAAKALAVELDWSGLWVAGGDPSNDGYVYVNIGRVDPLLVDPISRRGAQNVDWFIVESVA